MVDLKDGTVYEFDKDVVVMDNDYCYLKNIPVRDYPMLITFGDFIETVKK